MAQRIGSGKVSCALFKIEVENDFHLFFKCSVTRLFAFAAYWNYKIDEWSFRNVKNLIGFCVNPLREAYFRVLTRELFTSFLGNLFYGIWRFKNEVVQRSGREPRRWIS